MGILDVPGASAAQVSALIAAETPTAVFDTSRDANSLYSMRQAAAISSAASSLIMLKKIADAVWYTNGVDTTNYSSMANSNFSFVAPASGRVFIRVSFAYSMPAGAATLHMRLYDTANNPIAASRRRIKVNNTGALASGENGVYAVEVTALTPGTTYTYTLRILNTASITQVTVISDLDTNGSGPMVVEVWSQPAVATSDVDELTRTGPSVLNAWVAGKAAVVAGTRDCKVLLIGDSTMKGTSGNDLASQLTSVLAAAPYNLPVARGGDAPSLWNLPTLSPRYTPGAGWATGGNYGFGSQGRIYNNPAGVLTYTNTETSADRFDVYLLVSPTGGDVTMQVNAETPVVENVNGATGLRKVTLTVAAGVATTHVLKITATGTGALLMVEPWRSTAKRIRIASAAIHSSSAQTWATGSSIYSRSMISLYAPDVIVMLHGANDSIVARSPSDFLADVKTLLAVVPAADKIVLSPAPSQVPAEYSLMTDYAVRERYQLPYPFIDQLKHFGTYDAAAAAGWMTPPDQRHPSASGQTQQIALMAQMLASA